MFLNQQVLAFIQMTDGSTTFFQAGLKKKAIASLVLDFLSSFDWLSWSTLKKVYNPLFTPRVSPSKHWLFIQAPRQLYHLLFFLLRHMHCVKSVCIWSFLVSIFPHFDWIWRNTEHFSVVSWNTGKYGLEKLQIRTLFTQWWKFTFLQPFVKDRKFFKFVLV